MTLEGARLLELHSSESVASGMSLQVGYLVTTLLLCYIYILIPVRLEKLLYALNAEQHSRFVRRCLNNSLCDSEFHIHGVICMIVRHVLRSYILHTY